LVLVLVLLLMLTPEIGKSIATLDRLNPRSRSTRSRAGITSTRTFVAPTERASRPMTLTASRTHEAIFSPPIRRTQMQGLPQTVSSSVTAAAVGSPPSRFTHNWLPWEISKSISSETSSPVSSKAGASRADRSPATSRCRYVRGARSQHPPPDLPVARDIGLADLQPTAAPAAASSAKSGRLSIDWTKRLRSSVSRRAHAASWSLELPAGGASLMRSPAS
jgi:hypothetical protein